MICEACNQDVSEAMTCEPVMLRFKGDPKKYHIQAWRGDKDCICGVSPGGYHHVECPNIRCPRCGQPLGICPCVLDEVFEPPQPMIQ